MEWKIKCPICKTDLGYKVKDNKLIHLDVLYSSEAGMVWECKESEFLMSNIDSIDKYGNPTFKKDIADAIKAEQDRHLKGEQTLGEFDPNPYEALRNYYKYGFEVPEGKKVKDDLKFSDFDPLPHTLTFKQAFIMMLEDELKPA